MPSSITFTDSRVRANPASRNMKPACMKNTRNAVTSTHMVLMGFTYGGFGGGVASAAAGVAAGAGDAAGAGEAAGVVAAAGVAAGDCACTLEEEPKYNDKQNITARHSPTPRSFPPRSAAKYLRSTGSRICFINFFIIF